MKCSWASQQCPAVEFAGTEVFVGLDAGAIDTQLLGLLGGAIDTRLLGLLGVAGVESVLRMELCIVDAEFRDPPGRDRLSSNHKWNRLEIHTI